MDKLSPIEIIEEFLCQGDEASFDGAFENSNIIMKRIEEAGFKIFLKEPEEETIAAYCKQKGLHPDHFGHREMARRDLIAAWEAV